MATTHSALVRPSYEGNNKLNHLPFNTTPLPDDLTNRGFKVKRRGAPTVVTPSRPSSGKRSSRGSPTSQQRLSRLSLPPTLTAATPHNHVVYLIRHGQSKGQVAPKAQRIKDSSLLDCGLTGLGKEQASQMTSRYDLPPMDMVLCSPLTRALETALLAFPEKSSSSSPNNQILVHYELRELGRPDIPENSPRPWRQVLGELTPSSNERIDTRSLQPSYPWPKNHDRTPSVLRRNYVQDVFRWLAQSLQDAPGPQRIAVVCHFHVIRAALTDPRGFCDPKLLPDNAVPLACALTPDGRLELMEQF